MSLEKFGFKRMGENVEIMSGKKQKKDHPGSTSFHGSSYARKNVLQSVQQVPFASRDNKREGYLCGQWQ